MSSTDHEGRPSRPRKTQTGCITCRIRRVKCGEEQPQCQRCRTSGITCDGYATVPLSRPKLLEATRALTTAGYRGPAAQYLELYVNKKLASSSNDASEQGDSNSKSGSDNEQPEMSTIPQIPLTIVAARPPRQLSSFTQAESRFFDFFRSRTVRMIGKEMESAFWARIVLRLAHEEPAVKYAVLSLSALHQAFDNEFQGDGTSTELLLSDSDSKSRANLRGLSLSLAAQRRSLTNDASTHHAKAVTAARTLLAKGENIPAILVVCIAFVCYENITGRFDIAHVHRKSGTKILEQHKQKTFRPQPPGALRIRDEVMDSISEVLSRVDFLAMTFSDSRAPYEYTKTPMLADPMPPSPLAQQICTLSDAWGLMINDIRWIMKLFEPGVIGEVTPETFLSLQQHASINCSQWGSVLTRFEAEHSLTPGDKSRLSLLRIYNLVISAVVDAGPVGPESRFDRYYNRWAQAYDLCYRLVYSSNPQKTQSPSYTSATNASLGPRHTAPQSPFFTFEPGINIPLFLVGTRCRDPILRRKAIALLRHCNRQEGPWHSSGTAAACECVMRTEELSSGLDPAVVEHLPIPLTAESISEEARVHAVYVVADPQARSIALTLFMKPDGLNGEFVAREEVVTW